MNNMNSMNWRDNIGVEQIDSEYKVFNFNPLKLSIEDGNQYLYSGLFCFNESVDETLLNYIQIYLPKYICSFFHPISKLNQASLYFGIDDDGCVIGIPYIGIFDKEFINNAIDKICLSHIKFPNIPTMNQIRKSIKIDIIPVSKSKIISCSNHTNKKTNYSRYSNELDKIKMQNKIYKKKRINWNRMYDLKNLKLCDMINDIDTREYIWKYIKIKTGYMIKKFTNKFSHLYSYCDIYSYWDLMTDVKTNKIFDSLKIGTMFKICEDGLDIYKWVAMWKDSKFSMLKKAKPKKPTKKIDTYYPIFLLSQVSKMIPEWVKKNPDLNLFVIKISFDIGNFQQYLEYKDSTCQNHNNNQNKNIWKYSYRTMMDDIPMSPSFYSTF